MICKCNNNFYSDGTNAFFRCFFQKRHAPWCRWALFFLSAMLVALYVTCWSVHQISIRLFFVKSKVFTYEFWWKFSARWNSLSVSCFTSFRFDSIFSCRSFGKILFWWQRRENRNWLVYDEYLTILFSRFQKPSRKISEKKRSEWV